MDSTLKSIRVLSGMSERDEAGRHFTEVYPDADIESLESYGWIAIDRPVHEATGISWDESHWHMEATELGVKLAEIAEAAKAIGEEHRKAYIDEFGENPVVNEVGDWDSMGVDAAYQEIANRFDLEATSHPDCYSVTRIVYLASLFDTDDVS